MPEGEGFECKPALGGQGMQERVICRRITVEDRSCVWYNQRRLGECGVDGKKLLNGKLSVIMPAFNERSKIYENLVETARTLESLDFECQIVVVDDGSRDGTHTEALRACAESPAIEAHTYDSNLGKGHALRYGFQFSKGDYIAFLDVDLELHPKQIGTLLDYMLKHDADVVIGSKRHPQSELNYPWHRKVMSTGYYYLVKLLFGLPVKDTQTGIKVFKRRVLEDILPRILVKRHAFDLELLVNAHHLGYKIVEAPISLDFRRGFGRLGLRSVYNISMDTAAIFYRLYILRYYDKATNLEDS